jgi:RNA polymerase sigma factor (sigma-70 family)
VPSELQQTVDAVWRMEAAKIVATLTRAVGDVGLAEDLAQEALVDALEQWPATGVPRNAGAWLTTVAKRKAIDLWRRQDRLDAKYATLARELETHLADPTAEAWDPDRIDDDVLRLIFISAHPVLAREGQLALTLRVVGGLTTDEIAQAFLVPKATIAARITRAKKALGDAGVPFEVPEPSEYPQRLSTMLGVLPDLQRGLFGVVGSAVDPRRIVLRGTAPRPRTGRPGARRSRGVRVGGPDGVPVVTVRRTHRRRTTVGRTCPPGDRHPCRESGAYRDSSG